MGSIHQKVAIQGARFFAFHGFYEEEEAIGSEFIVDLEAAFEVFSNGKDDLSATVNYEVLYDLVASRMKVRQKLIESVAHSILESIRMDFLSVSRISVTIRKINPPLAGQVGNSLVELVFNR